MLFLAGKKEGACYWRGDEGPASPSHTGATDFGGHNTFVSYQRAGISHILFALLNLIYSSSATATVIIYVCLHLQSSALDSMFLTCSLHVPYKIGVK